MIGISPTGWSLLSISMIFLSISGSANPQTHSLPLSENESIETGIPHQTPVSDERLKAFHQALETVFPMTPEMVRTYQDALRDNQEATFGRTYPQSIDDAAMAVLQPGEKPIELNVSPGIASVVGFHDAAGNPWPIQQYVLGDGQSFEVAKLGERSSALVVSPVAHVGWTNLVIVLDGEETPIVLKVVINIEKAHFRRHVQVMKIGPNSDHIARSEHDKLPSAGDRQMLAALSGSDLGEGAVSVAVPGIDAEAWVLNDQLYVRSRYPLLSPPWTDSLRGPNGVQAYRMAMRSSLLFSIDGRVVAARLDLP